MAIPTTRPKSGGGLPRPAIGERETRIEGSFRRITVHQLVMAWWLYHSGHMTRRQYRVYFAAHELAERRRYTSPEHRGAKPLYTMGEIARLVGGRGDDRALRELRADLRALARLGLAKVTKHRVVFAVSADQLRIDDLSGFWSMFQEMPNRRRSVPVPRRLLRALAAGFSKGATALITAVLIRGLFWHKETSDYRTDGRYKLSWISKHFGISRRAATEARSKLVGLGWLEPIDVNQWEMNRWGLRDRIVTDWAPPAESEEAEAVGGQERDAISASPRGHSDANSASPDLTDSLSLTGDQKTRKLPQTANRSGVLRDTTLGSRKMSRLATRGDRPNIRDIRSADLESTERLLDLHQQAAAIGLVGGSDAGRLDFLALAERARSRGRRAGALFYWLLRERKFSFITHADEEAAARRLREHFNGPRRRHHDGEQWGGRETQRPAAPSWTEDDRIVMACMRVAQQRRLDDPFRAAQHAKGWTRDRWDAALGAYEQRRLAYQSQQVRVMSEA
jgi:hypothetical protein